MCFTNEEVAIVQSIIRRLEGVNEKTARMERFKMGNMLFLALQLTPMHLVATSR
jgi:hypothetical protein